jgi:hypothetical protein
MRTENLMMASLRRRPSCAPAPDCSETRNNHVGGDARAVAMRDTDRLALGDAPRAPRDSQRFEIDRKSGHGPGCARVAAASLRAEATALSARRA